MLVIIDSQQRHPEKRGRGQVEAPTGFVKREPIDFRISV
jgi:hypothetical protein